MVPKQKDKVEETTLGTAAAKVSGAEAAAAETSARPGGGERPRQQQRGGESLHGLTGVVVAMDMSNS